MFQLSPSSLCGTMRVCISYYIKKDRKLIFDRGMPNLGVLPERDFSAMLILIPTLVENVGHRALIFLQIPTPCGGQPILEKHSFKRPFFSVLTSSIKHYLQS